MRDNADARRGPPGGDDRGKFETWGVVTLVVALLVGAIMAAFLLPIGVDAIVTDNSASYTQNETETVVVSGSLNATLDNVGDTNGDIDVTLNDDEANETVSLTNIAVGSNQTATINGEEITVHNDANVDNTTADVTYDYPPEYNWGSGAKALWGILDVIIVLAMFLMFIAVALGAADKV